MIKRWRLGNFKSVRAPIGLEFSPLTVLVGPNSSGKSTVIQSILVAAQTISAQRDRGSILLNGDLAQLGNFRDVDLRLFLLPSTTITLPGSQRLTGL
ncbi:MAG: AAA family ATPase [Terriglobia bacterium]